MSRFAGFPAGPSKATPVPNQWFSEVLPSVESLAELKTTLHVFWLLSQKRQHPRCVTLRELLRDGVLLSGLGAADQCATSVREGLRSAVARGTLLHLRVELGGRAQDLFFLNNQPGREAVAKLRSGEIDLGQVVLEGEAETVPQATPNIFTLYEQNIGLLTPLLAEALAEAEKIYPAEWIADAFRQALSYNRRSWNYVRAILERWAIEGKQDEENRGGARRSWERQAPYRARGGASRRS